VTGSKS